MNVIRSQIMVGNNDLSWISKLISTGIWNSKLTDTLGMPIKPIYFPYSGDVSPLWKQEVDLPASMMKWLNWADKMA